MKAGFINIQNHVERKRYIFFQYLLPNVLQISEFEIDPGSLKQQSLVMPLHHDAIVLLLNLSLLIPFNQLSTSVAFI